MKTVAVGMLSALTLALVQPVASGQDKDGDEVREHVTKLGGTFARLPWPKDEVHHEVKLKGTKTTNDDLAPLGRLKTLTNLDLAFTKVTNAGLAHLVRLPALNSLNLTGTKITDAAVDELIQFPRLSSLQVAQTGITDKGAEALVKHFRNFTLTRVASGKDAHYQIHEEFRGGRLFRRYLMIGDTFFAEAFPRPSDKTFSPDGVDRSRLATTYYHRDGPVGQVMAGLSMRHEAATPASLVGLLAPASGFPAGRLVALLPEPPAFAVIRVNGGTPAAYGRLFQQIDFYDSTPELVAFSLPPKGQPRLFDYIHDARERGALVRVLEGDERTTLAKKAPKGLYAALFVEAARNDLRDINTALFTKEAMADMMATLRGQGVLCFHVSHRYHDLVPLVADAAKSLGFAWKRAKDMGDGERRENDSHFGSEWVMVARTPADLDHLRDNKTVTWDVPEATGNHLLRDGQPHDLKALERPRP